MLWNQIPSEFSSLENEFTLAIKFWKTIKKNTWTPVGLTSRSSSKSLGDVLVKMPLVLSIFKKWANEKPQPGLNDDEMCWMT